MALEWRRRDRPRAGGRARRALAWIDDYGDRDGDGFVEYFRRAPHGIDNQNWKDSHNSMVFHDGSVARAPIAAAEVQGYVYDAKLRVAELASEVWGDARPRRGSSARQRSCASASTRRSGCRSAAGMRSASTRRSARSTRSPRTWGTCSGVGSSAGADRHRCGAAHLRPLWSGWGVRTLAADEAAFDPLEYHNGTVWPHDNSLIALGLARAGHAAEARRVVRGAARHRRFYDGRLPELFSGYERSGAEPPVEVPTSARPQAWAAGTPLLLLRALLELEPDVDGHGLRAHARDLPAWAEGLALDGVHAHGRRWRVHVQAAPRS